MNNLEEPMALVTMPIIWEIDKPLWERWKKKYKEKYSKAIETIEIDVLEDLLKEKRNKKN